MNAFNEDMHRAFSQFWIDIDQDYSVRAVVVTGAGKAFSAGGNLDDFERYGVSLPDRTAIMRHSKRHVDEMINARMPVVAAVNGAAVGLGCTIASLSDIVFMADNARLMDPHVGVALVAGDGGAVTWPHLTSLIKAKQYLLTGDPIPAEEAVAIGLANFVVGRDELLPSAVAFAHRLASQPPQAVQETKSLLNQQLRLSAVAALGYGIAAETHAHDTPEYREAYERMRRGSND
jgi:enoyl-CoA hydratase/carnithine racemase